MNGRIPLQMIVRTLGLVLTSVCAFLIIYLSLIPQAEYPHISWIPFADKGDHMLAYTALGFSLFLATLRIPGSGKKRQSGQKPHSTMHLTSWSGKATIYSGLLGCSLGAIIEIIQPAFGRSREWLDLTADFMGLVVGIALALLLLKMVGSFFTTRPWIYDPNWKDDVDETR